MKTKLMLAITAINIGLTVALWINMPQSPKVYTYDVIYYDFIHEPEAAPLVEL